LQTSKINLILNGTFTLTIATHDILYLQKFYIFMFYSINLIMTETNSAAVNVRSSFTNKFSFWHCLSATCQYTPCCL